jgi:uncharacterized protein (TIGR03435 family)
MWKNLRRISGEYFMREKFAIYKKLFLSSAALGAFAAPIALSPAQAAPSQSHLQSGAPAASFEIISIKPTNPNRPTPTGTFTYPGGRIIITNYSLKVLIHEAYSIDDDQISGGPGWTSDERYDIEAIPPTSSGASKFSPATRKTPPSPEMLLMLQCLLADRFQLKLRTDTKIGRGYALVVGAHGARLTETKNHDAFKVVSYGHTGKPDVPDIIDAENASMPMFAAWLGRDLKCPVLDQTGISGNFDFKFEYASDESASDAGPSLFSAIQESLGLKLVSIKVPVETFIIEHAEKPSPN